MGIAGFHVDLKAYMPSFLYLYSIIEGSADIGQNAILLEKPEQKH